MASAQLNATPRSDVGKGVARSLRREGKIPAVIYGHARAPQPLAIDQRELDRLLSHIAAESTVIELSFDGSTSRTLIREIQRHPFKPQILHVDFQELVAGEKVTVDVPIVLVGVPEGVRAEGGVLDQTMRELSIHVDPANIPNHIDVDVSALNIGNSIHVSDLTLPEGVEVLDDEDSTICVVSAPRAVVEEAPAEEVAVEGVEEPEVIGKGKEEGAEEGEE
ncbi:MAG TPA: 50S ribosomal protein L25/general stress protein Ctc [Gemmatimonadaceae bacterium]|nr:50S ribosomal protein L25/general stress protein Ctc [Gemmatimonadaceae bacterium]